MRFHGSAPHACAQRTYNRRMSRSSVKGAAPLTPRKRLRPIPLAGLRGFEAAARLLSFTLAAEELALTQSSVSRQIAALERQVGKPLFLRRTRALELTPAGEQMYETVRRTLGEIDRSVARVRGAEA